MNVILLILLLMLFGAFPVWPHSANWGYYPAGGLSLVVFVLILILALQGPRALP